MTKNRDTPSQRGTTSATPLPPPPLHDCALLTTFRPCPPGGTAGYTLQDNRADFGSISPLPTI